MHKHIFIFISLFILCLSFDYIPMEKDSKYGDDICGYYDKNGDYAVKPCDSGKYCVVPTGSASSSLAVCQDVPSIQTGLSSLDEDCSSDFDCEYNLKCRGKKCKLSYDCTNSNQFPYKNSNHGGYYCAEKAPEGYCQYREYTNTGSNTYHSSPPTKFHICGVYTYHPDANNIYSLKDIKYAYIGSVDDGEYVSDKVLCKSGFALYYYPDGYLEDPFTGTSGSSTNTMKKRCVTPIAIDHNDKLSSSCVIYYKEKDDDTEIKKYNVDELKDHFSTTPISPSDTSDFDNIKNELCKYDDFTIKIQLQKFKEYNDKITEEQREKCGDLRSDSKNLRYVCDNKELIKLWYFYEHPNDYIAFNGREKLLVVLNHLIQREFPLYQFSHILNINYLIILLFLLCF